MRYLKADSLVKIQNPKGKHASFLVQEEHAWEKHLLLHTRGLFTRLIIVPEKPTFEGYLKIWKPFDDVVQGVLKETAVDRFVQGG